MPVVTVPVVTTPVAAVPLVTIPVVAMPAVTMLVVTTPVVTRAALHAALQTRWPITHYNNQNGATPGFDMCCCYRITAPFVLGAKHVSNPAQRSLNHIFFMIALFSGGTEIQHDLSQS